MTDYPYTGRRGTEITPLSAYENVEPVFVYAGEIGLALMPGSDVTKDFVYTGRRAAAILSDENSPEFSKEYAGSIEHGWIPDFAGLEVTFVYAGSIMLAVAPAAGYGSERHYEGSIEIALTPASAAVVDAVYSASIAVTLTPAVGAALLEKTYEGTILCTLRPISDYEGTGVTIREYTGNIPLSLLPQVAQAVRDAVYSGSLPLAFTPGAACELIPVGGYEYSGLLQLTLLPGSRSQLQGPVVSPRYKRTRISGHIVKTDAKDN